MGEAGATDLGNCGCVENAPGTGSGSTGGGQAPGGTVYLLPVNDTATRLPPPTPYYTLHPINWTQFDWLFSSSESKFFNNLNLGRQVIRLFPKTQQCIGVGKTTGNGKAGDFGALPGVLTAPGNVAIDPRVLGLPAGVGLTNSLLAEYAGQISISFSPPLQLPAGFPTKFTVGDIVGPSSARAQVPPIFDINALPSLQVQYEVTGIRQVTITYPEAAPFTCGGGFSS